jgi:hypothetical protein
VPPFLRHPLEKIYDFSKIGKKLRIILDVTGGIYLLFSKYLNDLTLIEELTWKTFYGVQIMLVCQKNNLGV